MSDKVTMHSNFLKKSAILETFLNPFQHSSRLLTMFRTDRKSSCVKHGYLLGQLSGPNTGSSFCAALIAEECSGVGGSYEEINLLVVGLCELIYIHKQELCEPRQTRK